MKKSSLRNFEDLNEFIMKVQLNRVINVYQIVEGKTRLKRFDLQLKCLIQIVFALVTILF